MSYNGVIINKNQGGLVRDTSTGDRIVLLVCGGTAVAGKLEHFKPKELNDISRLEDLGYTAETDTSKQELVHHHASEVFRLSPEMNLWIMLVPKTEKVSALCEKEEFLTALRGIEGVNTIGMAGMAADVDITTAVNASQKMVNELAKDHIYIDGILLEGIGTYLQELSEAVNLRELAAENISVVIAQDPAVAALNGSFAGYAAVGSALGMLSVRYVHENMGSVDIENHPRTAKGTKDYPLTSKLDGLWIEAALSNGTKVREISHANLKELDGKGYIYADSFQGYSGFFLSNSHTCVEAGSDYAYIEYNAIWNKGACIVRRTLIPRVRSKVKADPSTGYIANTTISDWDARVRSALEKMVTAEDIADFDIYINPKQQAVSAKPFNIKLRMVADGIVHEFEVDLGFTNKI